MTTNNPTYQGTWHIYEMEMWDEDYFNMEVQAYIEIKPNNLGSFQFGLVNGQIDGKVVEYDGETRFEFTWDGQGEYDPIQGSGWLKHISADTIEGEFRMHLGDDSTFKARKAS
jgi:hypothetical protein